MVPGNSTIELRKWISGREIGRFIRSLIFFIGFYLYLWLDVDLRLIYHGAGEIVNFPSFFTGLSFFHEFSYRPGGLIEYTAAFFSQFFYIGWAGALVATLQAWLIAVCVGYFINTIGYRKLCWIRFVPSLLLLVIYTRYTYHFVTVMALLAALVFVCLYLYIISKGPKSGWLKLIIFLILSVILYYIAAGAYLLFAVICAMYELLFRGRWCLVTVYISSAFVIPYVIGVLIFNESIVNAFSDLLPFSWKILCYKASKKMIKIVYLIYLLLPLTALILGLWKIFLKMIAKRKSQRKAKGKPGRKSFKPSAGIFAWYSRNKKIKWIAESSVLLGIAVGAVFLSYDVKIKTLFLVDYYAYNRMWPQVLHTARRHSDSFSIIHAVNRALYHTGKLNLEMFSYPQHSGTLFLNVKGSEFAHWKKFDFHIDLGLMNMAQNDLNECLEVFGERPMILKRLALLNMVKGDIESARIYLGALRKTLFDADWANNCLDRLQSDPNLAADDRIQNLRSVMLEKDYAFFTFKIEDILQELLEKNNQNRMAFEYLMALYILSGKLEKFANNFYRLGDFSYTQIPRIYEEALLLHVARTRKPFDLQDRQISMASHQRFKDFNQIFNRYRQNKEAAFDELARNFRNSYFLYYLYMLQTGKK